MSKLAFRLQIVLSRNANRVFDTPQRRALLGHVLGEVSAQSKREWGIVLSVLAVGKGENMPSGRRTTDDPSGFHAVCVEHGLDISDPYKLVVDEQRKVYNFARP